MKRYIKASLATGTITFGELRNTGIIDPRINIRIDGANTIGTMGTYNLNAVPQEYVDCNIVAIRPLDPNTMCVVISNPFVAADRTEQKIMDQYSGIKVGEGKYTTTSGSAYIEYNPDDDYYLVFDRAHNFIGFASNLKQAFVKAQNEVQF